MKPVFIDLHIHTSDNPNNLNDSYDLDVLKSKIEGRSEEHTSELQSHSNISYAVSLDRKSTRLNSSHTATSRMPSSA